MNEVGQEKNVLTCVGFELLQLTVVVKRKYVNHIAAWCVFIFED